MLLNCLLNILNVVLAQAILPTLYEYYTDSGKRTSGLSGSEVGFTLNSKPIVIFSGAIHYFRVHPKHWRDRLRKTRAAGLNTIETYVPWNLHEPQLGIYDFGDGTSTWSPFLDIRKFILTAQEEDLLVILRPGPYICAEWEYGGFPSYLQRDKSMKVRSNYTGYTERVTAYFDKLIPFVSDLQFIEKGPIIAFQIENEYSSFGTTAEHYPYKDYLKLLLQNFEKNGLKGLFFEADDVVAYGKKSLIPGVLQATNFQTDAENQIATLKKIQPDLPAFVSEYWTGWFDHWSEPHHTTTLESFTSTVECIFQLGASINFYMFHGGTNFDFMNGANVDNEMRYTPTVTSYDYDAPLSESGDYTPKYNKVKELVCKYNPILTLLPDQPILQSKGNYGIVKLVEYISLKLLLQQLPSDSRMINQPIIAMEDLPINNDNGQSYGLIAYCIQHNMSSGTVLKLDSPVYDLALVTFDGKLMSNPIATNDDLKKNFGSWLLKSHQLILNVTSETSAPLCILVENMGRVGYGERDIINNQKKGLRSGTSITLNGVSLDKWDIYALEFQNYWTENLQYWGSIPPELLKGPHLVKGTFVIEDDPPKDTFLKMGSPWIKGFVFINGFNIGRYFAIGPSKTLYIPGPLLKTGENKLCVFESFEIGSSVTLQITPELG